MSISEPLSEEEMREEFEAFLENPSDGVPSDCGFNAATEAAMLTVMKTPNDPMAIAMARARLEAQMKQRVGKELDDVLLEGFTEYQNKKRS